MTKVTITFTVDETTFCGHEWPASFFKVWRSRFKQALKAGFEFNRKELSGMDIQFEKVD